MGHGSVHCGGSLGRPRASGLSLRLTLSRRRSHSNRSSRAHVAVMLARQARFLDTLARVYPRTLVCKV